MTSTRSDIELIPAWLREENAGRTPRYKKDLDDEAFLFRMNSWLEQLEQQLDVPDEAPHPIILFCGLPRCGKTFFSQMVTNVLDVGFPNNVAARFWRAPVHGMWLSRVLGVEAKSDFASDYGKTDSLGDPHDFHYFWQHWLRVDRAIPDLDERPKKIDWDGLGRALRQVSGFWDKPVIMKAIHGAFLMPYLVAAYPKILYVFLERDLIDSAVSLLKAREDVFADRSHWFGQYPPPDEFEAMRDLPWHQQIPAQFRSLLEIYESNLGAIPDENRLRISYRDVCENPESVIEAIAGKCENLGTRPNKRVGAALTSIVYSSGKGAPEDVSLLEQGLRDQGLSVRYG